MVVPQRNVRSNGSLLLFWIPTIQDVLEGILLLLLFMLLYLHFLLDHLNFLERYLRWLCHFLIRNLLDLCILNGNTGFNGVLLAGLVLCPVALRGVPVTHSNLLLSVYRGRKALELLVIERTDAILFILLILNGRIHLIFFGLCLTAQNIKVIPGHRIRDPDTCWTIHETPLLDDGLYVLVHLDFTVIALNGTSDLLVLRGQFGTLRKLWTLGLRLHRLSPGPRHRLRHHLHRSLKRLFLPLALSLHHINNLLSLHNLILYPLQLRPPYIIHDFCLLHYSEAVSHQSGLIRSSNTSLPLVPTITNRFLIKRRKLLALTILILKLLQQPM